MKLNHPIIRGLFLVLLFVVPVALTAQNGTITIRKPGETGPCGICNDNKFSQVKSGITVKINRTREFKKQNIRCFKVDILWNDSLTACYTVTPGITSPLLPVPPGTYNVIARADNNRLEIENVTVAANNPVSLSFNFVKEKKRKKIP